MAIVDDDAGVRVGLRRLCEVFDLGVSVYASGHEFLASLDHGRPHADCLLIDAHMPTMTGVELQHDLLSRGVQIPTIVFTGDDPDAVSAHHTGLSVVACLRKPVESDDLIAAKERAVGAVVSDRDGPFITTRRYARLPVSPTRRAAPARDSPVPPPS